MLGVLELVASVGNPTDMLILAGVLYLVRHEIRPKWETVSAAVVALARREEAVDDTALQSELDVPERDVAEIQDVVVCGPPENDD